MSGVRDKFQRDVRACQHWTGQLEGGEFGLAKRLAHHRESRKRTNASAPKTPQIAIAFLKFDKALSMRTSTFPLGKKSAVETALLAPLARARLLITLSFLFALT